MCVRYRFNMYSTYLQYMFNMYSTCVQYAFNICSIYVQYTFNMYSICIQYVFNIPAACVQHASCTTSTLCWTCIERMLNIMEVLIFNIRSIYVQYRRAHFNIRSILCWTIWNYIEVYWSILKYIEYIFAFFVQYSSIYLQYFCNMPSIYVQHSIEYFWKRRGGGHAMYARAASKVARDHVVALGGDGTRQGLGGVQGEYVRGLVAYCSHNFRKSTVGLLRFHFRTGFGRNWHDAKGGR